MNSKKKLIVFLLIQLFSIDLYSQPDSKTELDFLFNEINLYLNYHNATTTYHSLADSLQNYAQLGEYDIAIVFAEMILDSFRQTGPVSQKEQKPAESDGKYKFRVIFGADLNRQEFEIAVLEKDSLLVDEIQKPFIGTDFSYRLKGDSENGILSDLGFRIDKQNMRGNAELLGKFQRKSVNGGAALGFIYDKDQLYPELSFNELNSKQYVNYQSSKSFFSRFNNVFRYKDYQKKNDNHPDFIFDQLNLMAGTNIKNKANIVLNYNMMLNQSIQSENYDYFENEALIDMSYRFSIPLSIESSMGFRKRNYSYSFQDSVIENQASAPFIQVKPLIRLPFGIIWQSNYNWEYKYYLNKSEDDPDHYLNEFQSTFQFPVSRGLTLECGYNYEQKVHLYFAGAVNAYIDEQNYTGNGVIAGFDYFNTYGVLVSLNASYTWRRYPYASVSDEFGIYSNRNVFNTFFNVQVPLTEHLNFILLLVYDNDKDLDSDHNNYNSMIFSSEFTYNF